MAYIQKDATFKHFYSCSIFLLHSPPGSSHSRFQLLPPFFWKLPNSPLRMSCNLSLMKNVTQRPQIMPDHSWLYSILWEWKKEIPPPPEIQFENAKTDVDYFLSLHYSKPNTSGSSHIDSEGLLRYNLWTFIPLLSCTVSVFLLMYKSSLCVQPRVSKGLMVAALWNNKWKQ